MKSVSIILLFTLFLQPYHYGAVSANYLFILFPLFVILYKRKLYVPPALILISICFFTIILNIGYFFQPEYYEYGIRRLLSYIVFMSMFSFSFIPINKKLVNAFKISLVIASLCVMLPIMYKLFFISGLSYLSFGSKGNLGSQRYGFVYIIAFWLVLTFKTKTKYMIGMKFIILAIILFGILITFSRASIVSLLGSIMVYLFNQIFIHKNFIRTKVVFIILSSSAIFLIYVVINTYAPFIVAFFDRRLFGVLASSGLSGFELDHPNSSIGYRLFMLRTIFEFVSNHLFTGSGFLGVWILFSDLSGSAHNQYSDVLFRTGILGLFIYLYFNIKIIKYTYHQHKDLFFGIVGVMIYGLFHETVKMSQGGFIFAFLLALSYQKILYTLESHKSGSLFSVFK